MNISNLLRLTQASAGSAASAAVASSATHIGPGEILSGFQGYSVGHHYDRGSNSYKYDHPCIQPNYRTETSIHMELQSRNTTTNSQEHMQSLTVLSAGAQSGVGPNHLENKPMAPPSLPSRSSPPRSTQPTDSSALTLVMESGHKTFSQEQHTDMNREQRSTASSSPPSPHSSSQLSCNSHHRYGDGGRLIEQNQQSSPPITHRVRVHPFQQQYHQQPYNHFQPVQSRSVGSGLNTIYKMDRDRAQTGTTTGDTATAVAQAHNDSINGTHSNARVRSSLSGSSNASNAPLNWSSLRNEIVSSDSPPPPTSNSTFGAVSFGTGRQSESTPLPNTLPPPSSSRAFPPPPSSSTTFWPSSSSEAVSIPASAPSPHKKGFGHDVNEHAQVTGSTFTSDTGQQRRTSTLSTTIKTEEDQELLRAPGVAAGRGENSAIMGAVAYHASCTPRTAAAAGTAGSGGDGEEGGLRGTSAVGGIGPTSPRQLHASDDPHPQFSRPSSSSSPPRQDQEHPLQYGHHHHHNQLLHQPKQQSVPDASNSSSSHKRVMGRMSVHSLSSSTAPFALTAGTPDPTTPTKSSSFSINSHPSPFDQSTGFMSTPSHNYSHHHPYSNNTTSNNINNNNNNNSNSNSTVLGSSVSSLSNKRRSLADLLFVPTKIKEKRGSCASSVSSIDSYRQEEGMDHPGLAIHPKSASTTSTSTTTSASSIMAQRGTLDSQTTSLARKSSISKGSGKSTGGGTTSSPKTFQCTGYPGCNMVFTRSEHLARHERKHTGEKPYKCIVANCPRTFSRYDNMIQHTQTHGDRTKRDSLVAPTAAGGTPQSRPSSVQSTPLISGRPRGGSSPVVFGPGYESSHYRSQQNSPASSSFGISPAFPQHHQHHHPYSPHHQHQQQSHPMQWTLPSGAPASSSPALLTSRSQGGSYGGEGQLGHSNSGPSTPVIRTLKSNSRSLPHLQPRSSPNVSADNSSIGPQHGMSGTEKEELKRRKSEILLPSSSFSGASTTASGYNQSQNQSHSHGQGQGIGLGMSPFTTSTAHPQSLAQVESLTPQELERLNEHRRSAQLRMSSSSGSSSSSATLMDRSSSMGSSLGRLQHLSVQEQDRLLEHRKSTPDLMYDSRLRRLSKESVDMIVQPLPSRDTRSGMQWFSQVNNTPLAAASPRPSLTPRDTHLVHVAAEETMGTTSHRVSDSSISDDSSTMLPPIWRNYSDSRQDLQAHIRAHSSHIHPLSRPSYQNDLPSPDRRLSHEEPRDRFQFDPMLSPRMERYLEEQYYPVRKREVLDAIERMETHEFLRLKSLVTESYANEQFRNPECLVNMAAVLCAIKTSDRPSSRDMIMDYDGATSGGADSNRAHGDQEAMDVDDTGVPAIIEKGQRFVPDIDIDSFRGDPEPDIYGLGSLTIKSQGPATSFVAGFEPVIENELEDPPRSVRSYPHNARIGRFYFPESSYWTPESLSTQLDPNGPWVCCRFEEYQGVWIWVRESVLDKYHEIAQRHKMALTLAGTHLRDRVHQSVEDWHVSDERSAQCEVRMEESAMYPEMMRQVWRDMYQHYQQQQHPQYYQQQKTYSQQYQHRHSQHYSSPPPPQPQSIPRHSLRPSQPLPPLSSRVATFEEYQKAADHRRDSISNQHTPSLPPPSSISLSSSTASAHSVYYNDYRQHQQSLHREDLSSAPSSPRSPQRDDFQEDNQTNESAISMPQQDANTINLHRRISIAELCNPMQSLATERNRFRDDSGSLSMPNTTTATTTNRAI